MDLSFIVQLLKIVGFCTATGFLLQVQKWHTYLIDSYATAISITFLHQFSTFESRM